MGKRKVTHDLFMKWIGDQKGKYVICCIQEPYFKQKGFVGVPKDYSAYYVTEERGKKEISRAVVMAPKCCEGYLLTQHSTIDCSIVRFPKLNITVISAYCDVHKSVKEITSCVEREALGRLKIICCMDTNAYSEVWGSKHKVVDRFEAWARGKELLNDLEESNLTVVNIILSLPTYRSENGRISWIDVTFVSCEIVSRVVNWCVGKTDFMSDHELIAFEIVGKEQVLQEMTSEQSLIVGTPWKKMTEKISEIVSVELEGANLCQRSIRSKKDLNIFLDKHISQVKQVLNRVYRPKKKRYQAVYWWTEEVKIAHSQYKVARRRAKKYKHGGLWEECREKRRLFKKVVNRVKLEKWHNLVANTSDPWEKLMKILKAANVGKANERTLCDTQGLFAEDIEGTIDKIMTQFFPPPIIKNEFHLSIERKMESYLKTYTEGPKFTTCEFNNTLGLMNRNSAPGLDGMTMNLVDLILKKRGMASTYLSMYNCCLKYAYVLKVWKKSKVILIPKQGLEMNTTKAFRPISLTSNLCKILERMILQRVQHYIEMSGKLSPSQHAYRKGGSTLTALHETFSYTENALLRREVCVVVFLDISGAFDLTWHYGILGRLLEYGVPQYLVAWVKSFLDNRTAEMTSAGVSRTVKLEQGCPQGGVLSPVLWNVLFNDFLLIDSSHQMKIVGYADDAAVMCTAKTVKGASAIASNVLRKISNWAKDNRVTFNIMKLKAMTIHKGTDIEENEVWFEGNRVKEVSQHKYLGVIVDNKLSWKQHFDETQNKLDKVIRILRPTVGSEWRLRSHIFKILFHAIFKPIMLYASPIWGWKAIRTGITQKFDRLIRKYCLMTIRCFRTTSSEILFRMVGTENFKDMLINEVQMITMTQLQVIKTPKSNLYNSPIIAKRKMPISSDHFWYNCRKQFSNTLVDIEVDNLLDYYKVPPFEWRTTGIDIKDKKTALWRNVDMRGWIIYVDASVSSYGAGWSVMVFKHGLAISRSIRSTRRISPFTAEIQAVIEACKYIENNIQEMYNMQVIIRCDSQAAIMALNRVVTIDTNIKEVKEALDRCAGKKVDILLQWVPSHSEVLGNEIADYYAKKAVDSVLNKEVPDVIRDLKMKIHQHIRRNRTQTWESLNMNVPKMFFPLYQKFKAYQNASCLPNINQMVTGHCKLNYFLFHKIHCIRSPLCLCGEEDETVDHYFLKCINHSEVRKEIWGAETCVFEDIIDDWGKINEFVKRTGRFRFSVIEATPTQT